MTVAADLGLPPEAVRKRVRLIRWLAGALIWCNANSPGGRLAARRPYAHRPRPRRAQNGVGNPEPGADFALVAHTDRGSQYTFAIYTQTLQDHGVLASVRSVGDAFDNAVAESFVDSLKTELIADRVWRTKAHLELAIVQYISWFNHDRLHSTLGGIPPVEFEALAARQCQELAR